ncbi:MAG TPA: DUF1656 domain-containing protein [Rhizomicrobium sp.]|jgi:hypothetical protein|nr:DUF1656 domain-containing protein [Rhizomicrobium sp.]
MTGEINAFGVFVPIALVTALAAFAASIILRRILRAINAYGFIWHAGLFDVATFVVLWWLIASAAGTPTV